MGRTATEQSNLSRPQRSIVMLVIVVLAAGWWVYRGPVRALSSGADGTDFALIYSAARAFFEGVNPYEAQAVAPYWPGVEDDGAVPHWRGSRDLLYPPTTLAMVSPLTVLGWRAANIVWLLLSTAGLIASVLALAKLASIPLRSDRGLLLVACALAWAPVHSTLVHGQTSLIVLGLIAVGHAARLGNRPILSGVLIGLSAALKPQLGLVFLVYELFRRRLRAALSGFAMLGLVFAIGAVRLQVVGVDWIAALSANVREFTTIGAGDPTLANLMRYQLINLHYPLHSIIESRQMVSILVWLIVGALAMIYALIWMRRREERAELLTLSMACPLALLLAYHRSYDAVILMIPIAWAISRFGTGVRTIERLVPIAALFACSAYLMPSSALLFALESRGTIPESFASSTFYVLLIQPHQVWALGALAIILIVAILQRPSAPMAIFKREPAEDAGDADAASSPPATPTAPARSEP